MVSILSLYFLLAPFTTAEDAVHNPTKQFSGEPLGKVTVPGRPVCAHPGPLKSRLGAFSQDQNGCFIHIGLPHTKLYFHVAEPGSAKDLSVSLPITITSSHPQRLVIRGKDPESDVSLLSIVSSGVERSGYVKPTEKGTSLSVRWYVRTLHEYPEWTSGEPVRLIREGTVLEGVSWALGSSLPGEARCEIKCELVPDKYQIDGRYSNHELTIDFVPMF